MPFAGITATDEAMFIALVGQMNYMQEMAFAPADNVHGENADGRPIVFRGVGQPRQWTP